MDDFHFKQICSRYQIFEEYIEDIFKTKIEYGQYDSHSICSFNSRSKFKEFSFQISNLTFKYNYTMLNDNYSVSFTVTGKYSGNVFKLIVMNNNYSRSVNIALFTDTRYQHTEIDGIDIFLLDSSSSSDQISLIKHVFNELCQNRFIDHEQFIQIFNSKV